MLGRISKVAAGVTVGLVAAAPMAWAGGTGYDDAVKGDKVDSGKHDYDHKDKDHKDKDKDHDGDHDGDHGFAGKVCSFEGGDAGAASVVDGGLLANVVAQAPIAGNQIGNLANCSDFLNNNLNGNLSGNQVAILGGVL